MDSMGFKMRPTQKRQYTTDINGIQRQKEHKQTVDIFIFLK